MSFLEENSIKYDSIFMDEISIKLKIRAKEEFKAKFNEKMNLPALVINDSDYQIGFIRVAWERLFSTNSKKNNIPIQNIEIIKSKTGKFIDVTAKYKQWYVNPDNSFRQKLEEGLNTNYQRYGFYHCPCRDTDGDVKNKDIACPCNYAENDIKEWGQCYCGLYVSEEFYTNRVEPGSIPERREDI